MALKTKAIIEESNGMTFIGIGTSMAEKFVKKGVKRCICTLNGKSNLHVALQSRKEEGYFIYISKRVLKELSLKKGMTVQMELKEDESQFQFEKAAEWNEVLATDPIAKDIFDQLTPGNQRSILYLITRVKSSEKRIERSLHIAEQLKRGIHSAAKLMKK
jgi:transcription termination factor Rho